MPETKFQEVIFTFMMVVVMVYGMVVYNISLDQGGLTNIVFVLALKELVIMGIVGMVLEMLVAGKIAQMLAFRIVTPGKDRMCMVILSISAFTVCVMCPLMSFVATCLFKGIDGQLFSKWIQTTIINFPMALCWQLVVAGPLVRLLFRQMFPQKQKVIENE